jgi:hypothetical protein
MRSPRASVDLHGDRALADAMLTDQQNWTIGPG